MTVIQYPCPCLDEPPVLMICPEFLMPTDKGVVKDACDAPEMSWFIVTVPYVPNLPDINLRY